MAYQQDATFRISGRITSKKELGSSTQIGVSIQRREADPASPKGWKLGRVDHFVLNITNAAMQAYLKTLGPEDLIVAEGDLVTTNFTPDGSVRPVNATKMAVHRLSGVPRASADLIDREVDRKPIEAGKAPF